LDVTPRAEDLDHALRYERRADLHETFLMLDCALLTSRYLMREF